MFFVWEKNLFSTKVDSYFGPRPKKDTETDMKNAKMELAVKSRKNEELIFYIDRVTSI